MKTSEELDSIVALRMLAAHPDVAADPHARPPFVSREDAASAKRLAGEPDALAKQLAGLPIPPVLRIEHALDSARVRDGLAAYAREHGRPPAAVAVPGHGLYLLGETPHELWQLRQAAGGAAPDADPAERRPPAGRLRGCVAMVTGSAQGFGKGIAEALAREGAAVAVADLNVELGQAFAHELDNKHGEGTALFTPMNVTDSTSIDAGVQDCVRHFGGIDLFVSNAGVLRAGGLDEMDERAFNLVTDVNYKAYFLCARAVAPWMKRQHELNPHHFADIVQINSKSGLEGSKRNFAYAGSKFGAIGLTQSFALELVPWNIKVNAICPGNFFDGPLWADPENGLFVQYLRAGKVPGAKTLDDVRTFYMSKIPMNRGCTPEDVATAIFYLCDQRYETGQALPVTGGQVMLS